MTGKRLGILLALVILIATIYPAAANGDDFIPTDPKEDIITVWANSVRWFESIDPEDPEQEEGMWLEFTTITVTVAEESLEWTGATYWREQGQGEELWTTQYFDADREVVIETSHPGNIADPPTTIIEFYVEVWLGDGGPMTDRAPDSGYYTHDNNFMGSPVGYDDPQETNIIPELATIAIPVVSILGLLLLFNHRKRRREQ